MYVVEIMYLNAINILYAIRTSFKYIYIYSNNLSCNYKYKQEKVCC